MRIHPSVPLLLLAVLPVPGRAQIPAQDIIFPPLPELEHPVGLELLFGPQDNTEARIIKAIDGAKQEVLVNHYLLTSSAIIDALQDAFARKCFVMAFLDSDPAVQDYQGINELRRRHIPVVAAHRSGGRWNNSKYIIIDRSAVLVGTCDLTNAARRNDEVLMVLEEPSVVISFYNHFVQQVFPKKSQQPQSHE